MGKSVSLFLVDADQFDIMAPLSEAVGVDGGAAYCLKHQIDMIFAIGDFDSIDEATLTQLHKTTRVIQYPIHKDQPDSQLAIEKLLSMGYDDLHLYGALGGRYDHHHANIVLAYRYGEVTLHQGSSTIKSYGEGTHTIKKESHEKLSVFTFEKAVLSLSGVEYPLDHYTLTSLDILGLSNTFKTEAATLTVSAGRVLVYCEKA